MQMNDHGYKFSACKLIDDLHYYIVTFGNSVVCSGHYKAEDTSKFSFMSTSINTFGGYLLNLMYDNQTFYRMKHDHPKSLTPIIDQLEAKVSNATKAFDLPLDLSNIEIKDAHHATLHVTGSNIEQLFDVPGYEDLAGVLTEAYDQSARGKGKERHANAKPFTQQPIMRISRGRSGIGGLGYQVQKKTDEAIGMVERGNAEAACKELMGAIVYAAAAILLIREQHAGELPVSPVHHPV